MITVIARIDVQPGQEQAFIRAMSEVAAKVREEDGNHAYEVHQGHDDPASFLVYEQYTDRAALDAHREHMKEIGQEIGKLITGPPSLELYRPIE